jgi:outer membrane protein assembly factor BamB
MTTGRSGGRNPRNGGGGRGAHGRATARPRARSRQIARRRAVALGVLALLVVVPVVLAAQPATNKHRRAPVDHSVFQGQLLIADRGNNRLLLVDAHKRLLWQYPTATRPAPPGGFYFPDDAFFVRHGTAILSNQEDNNTLVIVAYPSGRLLWSYGHPKVAGSTPGYLNQPDDAYLLKNGDITVADAKNCRILVLGPGGGIVSQIGTTGYCVHAPPRGIGYPNGDTPLADGNFLISEINGSWVSEYTPQGQLVWTAKLPIAYPSDPQQLGPNLYMVANYHRPGGVYEFDRQGNIVWSYAPSSGPGMLNHPSLAERLPNGLIAVNDDYRDRVVLIDPKTQRIVWQYGQTDHAGTAPGLLKIPDGLDLLQKGGRTPTHPTTG